MGKLDEIDVACIEDLTKIAKEREEYEGFLRKAEALESETRPAVFKQVCSEYRRRLEQLESDAAPAKEAARDRYREVLAVGARLTRTLDEVSLKREELELRRKVGQLSDEDFSKRLREVTQGLEQEQAELEELERLKNRFLEVYPGIEGEIAPEQPGGRDETKIIDLGRIHVVTPGPPEEQQQGKADLAQNARQPDSEKTAMGPIVAANDPDSTLSVPLARLVREETGEQYHLGSAMSIGRDDDNQIQIDEPGVSRKHASVFCVDGGFKIKDEGSSYGTVVNEEKIKEQALTDGDSVRIGGVKMTFRSP